jgi:hypothetical protein
VGRFQISPSDHRRGDLLLVVQRSGDITMIKTPTTPIDSANASTHGRDGDWEERRSR